MAAAVVLLMTVVVLSYRQVVRAYPSGGGSYEVASTNLGRSAGLVVAARAAGRLRDDRGGVGRLRRRQHHLGGPALNEHRVPLALGFVALLTAMNLRGVRESGRAFAVPTYAVHRRRAGHDRAPACSAPCSATHRSPRAPAYASTRSRTRI